MTLAPPARQSFVRQDTNSEALQVRLVKPDAGMLRPYLPEWDRLAAHALQRNVFYEPWMLLPAMQHLDGRDQVSLLLIFGPAGSNGVRPLWGLFPLHLQSRCLRLPIRALAFWQHRYCYLTVPLVDRDHAEEVLEAFWRWFERNPLGCRVLDTNYLPGEGLFHARWADALIGRYLVALNEYPRGMQTRAPNFESYVSRQLSKKRYHAICRGRRHLDELGRLEFRKLENRAGAGAWIEQFLQLESLGWKGRVGGAIAQTAGDAGFFREIATAGFCLGRARFLSLELNGRPIAMKLALTCGDGGYIFKIAYDESYAKFSPGVVLELEDLRSWHGETEINSMDSCASPRHPLYDLISNDRRVIRRTLVSNRSRLGDLFLSALPLLRWLRHHLVPLATPDYLRVITQGGPSA